MRKHKAVIFLACMVIVALACTAAMAATVTITGQQTRGTGPLKNAKLECTPVTLPSEGVISAASTTGDGFWINDGYGNWIVSFYNPGDAKGYRLPAGTYSIYPNLKQGQYNAVASITITY
jgi:hypothetical protein